MIKIYSNILFKTIAALKSAVKSEFVLLLKFTCVVTDEEDFDSSRYTVDHTVFQQFCSSFNYIFDCPDP